MTCNCFRMPRITLREAKETLGDKSSDLTEPDLWRFRPKGMSSAQFDDWKVQFAHEWAEKHDQSVVPPGSNPVFMCGDLIADICACGTFADHLCDYPMGRGKTCDAPLCARCKRSVGEDRDLCIIHHAEFMGTKSIGVWPPAKTKGTAK